MFLWFLVATQFLLAAAIVVSARWSPFPVLLFLGSGPGIVLAVWAWVTIGLTKIRIHPATTERTQFMTAGPYRLVRHPMYTGLIWFTAALLFDPIDAWRVVSWCAMVAVLIAKSQLEERLMQERFPEYENYRRRVGGLLPKLKIWNTPPAN
ncbi:MAG: isoprenylcysteine carboxylmethyltransferase family protein [Planctomycetales bacterium]|nr:isoprenylcysteine carboxylmethyltransferase family protein [Planctomycetales bacterium]